MKRDLHYFNQFYFKRQKETDERNAREKRWGLFLLYKKYEQEFTSEGGATLLDNNIADAMHEGLSKCLVMTLDEDPTIHLYTGDLYALFEQPFHDNDGTLKQSLRTLFFERLKEDEFHIVTKETTNCSLMIDVPYKTISFYLSWEVEKTDDHDEDEEPLERNKKRKTD
jgi:hypothetical protein